MAIVTRLDIDSDTVYTIKTLFAKLTVNTLFTFLGSINESLNRDFRLSLDYGVTYGSWINLTDDNIRAIDVNPNVKLAIQVRYSPNASYLLINDAADFLLINNSGDAVLISG